MALLNLYQTDLNLLRDFRWVAKQTRKFPRKYTQVATKKIKVTSWVRAANILYFIG